jgi:uncharacterized repeat protein (TIGR01451 family)
VNRKKVNIEDVNTLLATRIPKMESDTRRQIHSLVSLLVSVMFITLPLTSVASAGSNPVIIHKTVLDVGGQGSQGNVTAAGQIIYYQINVTNTRNVNLNDVTVTDPLIGNNLSGPTPSMDNDTLLDVGESWIFTGNYTVTQADLNSNGSGTGFIINNANVTLENEFITNDTVSVPIEQNANCTIVKTVESVDGVPGGNVTVAGDVIAYQVNVTNTGNIDLSNVTVTDPLIGNNLTGPTQSMNNDTVLDVGESWIYSGNYTVTSEDINSDGNGTGFIINNATVDSYQLDPENATVSTPIANCTIEKTVTGVTGDGNGNVTAEGDVISYQIEVDNNGQVNLTNVTVTDPLLGILNVTDLGIGNSTIIYGNYTVTQEDMNSNGSGTGFILNNATVESDQLVPENATVQTPVEQNPDFTIVKSVESVDGVPGGNVTAAGDIIDYMVNVTNTGNIDLYNVTVTDPMIADLAGPTSSMNNDSVLNVGESWIYTGNYTVAQEDINTNGTTGDGFINNNATVAGNYTVTELDANNNNTVMSHSEPIDPEHSSARARVERDPSYIISKSEINPDPNGDCIINKDGDLVPYRIVVQNNGNVDLTNVTVEDPLISLIGPTGDDNDPGIMNPGETWIYSGNYTLTQEDINTGNINNTATVSSNELPEENSNVDTPVDQSADLSIYKSVTGIDETGDHLINNPGEVINYQIAVKNNGYVDLHNVHVIDSLLDDLSGPAGDSIDPGILNPGETWVYSGDYSATQNDFNSVGVDGVGLIENTATVNCDGLNPESSSIIVPIFHIPLPPINVTPEPIKPGANFSTNITSGYAPLSVQFTDSSTGSPTSWNWDFGDGNAGINETSPAHTYSTAGTYVAKLTVSNANGTDTKNTTITVQQVSNSNNGGSGGGSSGGSSGGSRSSTATNTTPNVTQTETSTPNVVPSTTPVSVQPTPVQTATSTPAKKKTPGFEIISAVTALLGAIYLYRRR